MGDNKEIVFDLTVLLKAIKKNILPLILATVIFGVGSFFGTQYLMEKQYKASAMIIVNNKASEASGFNSAEIVAAQDLASVYSIIIKSDTVIDKVIKNLKLNMTYEQLVGAITVTPVNSTQVIQISMVGNNLIMGGFRLAYSLCFWRCCEWNYNFTHPKYPYRNCGYRCRNPLRWTFYLYVLRLRINIKRHYYTYKKIRIMD